MRLDRHEQESSGAISHVTRLSVVFNDAHCSAVSPQNQ
jgi:hypothetical protein